MKKTMTLGLVAALLTGVSFFAQPAHAQWYNNGYGMNGMGGMFRGCHHHHHRFMNGLGFNNGWNGYNTQAAYNPYNYNQGIYNNGYGYGANGYGNGYYPGGLGSVFGRVLNRW